MTQSILKVVYCCINITHKKNKIIILLGLTIKLHYTKSIFVVKLINVHTIIVDHFTYLTTTTNERENNDKRQKQKMC